MKTKKWYSFISILVTVFCLMPLAGCRTAQIDQPQYSDFPAQADESNNDDLSKTVHNETLAIELPGTVLTADFIVPDSPNWEIIHIIHDDESDSWAILYAINQDNPRVSQQAGGIMWENAHILIQLFDGQGCFIKLIDTNYEPVTGRFHEIISSEPITFNNHMLSFFADKPYIKKYIFVDTQTEDISSVRADDCVIDGEHFLVKSLENGGTTYVLQLLHKGEPVSTIEIELPEWYSNLIAFFGGERLILLPKDDRIATLSGRTITYLLDFNQGTYEVLRHYSLEELDNLVTANDRWELYNANSGRYEGGYWGETVLRNKLTEEFKQLHNRYAYSAAFAGEDLLLISETWGLLLFDLNEMQVVRDLLPVQPDGKLDRVINGVAFDAAKNWFVVAWLEFDAKKHSYGLNTNVMISTYSIDGDLLRTIDTEVEMPMYPSMYSVLELELVIGGDGNVLFRNIRESDADFTSIRYWD